MVFSSADNEQFVEAFGQEVTFTLSGGGTIYCNAVFDDKYVAPAMDDFVVETSSPALTCLTSDITSVSKGDTVDVVEFGASNVTTYNVIEIQPDGTGMTVVILGNQYD